MNRQADRLLRRREVEVITGLSRTRIYELLTDHQFPQQVRIGRAVRWSDLEVRAWIAEHLAGRDQPMS